MANTGSTRNQALWLTVLSIRRCLRAGVPRPDASRHRRGCARHRTPAPASLPAGRKSVGHRGCELHIADLEPREADPAEIVDPLDAGRHQVRRRRRDANEFRPHAELDLGARRQRGIGLPEGDGMAADPRLAPRHFGRQHVHAGRADEIADEGVRRPLEQFLRRADLHHARRHASPPPCRRRSAPRSGRG